MDEEKLALAGELALGLLDGEEQRQARRAMAQDETMRAAYLNWAESLARLHDDTPEVAPAPHVLRGIEGTLFDNSVQADLWTRWKTALLAPENREIVAILVAAKIGLLVWILYLFL
ncbi:hypothetical protein [Pseudooceanicola aestuarii]|uniref:hypothetical protein n=1 Tax=Pseudooceanicola aestuarii TaxID=2697319 RepID=UPI001952DB3B|nr:hypothetical protein [Pseudooceanicola aestuarii]